MRDKRFRPGSILILAMSILVVAGCYNQRPRQNRYNPYVRQQLHNEYARRADGGLHSSSSTQTKNAPVYQLSEFGSEPSAQKPDEELRSVSLHPPGDTTSLIRIERTAPAQVNLNQSFESVIKVTNVSGAVLKNVTVNEPYPSSFKYESASPGPSSHQDRTLTWKLGNLTPRATRTLKTRGSATSGTRLNDCITVTCTYEPSVCIDIRIVDPKLEFLQTGPKTMLQCDLIPMTFTVRNGGTGVARGIVIKGDLPEGLLTIDAKKSIFLQAGDLESGVSKTLEMKLKAVKAGQYEVKTQAVGSGSLKSSAAYSVAVLQPILKMTKSGPDKRFAGRPATYDITVTNQGDGEAKDLVITDSLPNGATFVSASYAGEPGEGKVVWNLGSLAPGASKKVSLKAQLNKIGTAVNRATANAHCASTSAECRTNVFGIAAILLEVIDLNDPIEVGSNCTYSISVTNQGSAVGTNIKIVATLPNEQQYVTSSGPTQAVANGKVISFLPLPRLAPKAKVEYRVEIKGVKAGDLRFHVELNSDQMSSPVMETESTHAY